LWALVGQQKIQDFGGIVLHVFPDILVAQKAKEKGHACFVEVVVGQELQQERHEIGEVSLDAET